MHYKSSEQYDLKNTEVKIVRQDDLRLCMQHSNMPIVPFRNERVIGIKRNGKHMDFCS